MLFLQNKYTSWYFSIINKAKERATEGYAEKHHIVPKTLGGKNNKSNIVILTAREHFICHLLLTKMLIDDDRHKMVYALHMLSNASNKSHRRTHTQTQCHILTFTHRHRHRHKDRKSVV